MKIRRFALIALLALGICPRETPAETLGNVAIFYRCYGQLTGAYLAPNSALLQSVAQGTVQPIDACIGILRAARFPAGQMRLDGSNATSVQILNTFHKLHASWFQDRQLHPGTAMFHDETTPALYFTRALFDSTVPFSSIMTANANLRAYRVTHTPATYNGVARASLAFSGNVQFSDLGNLLGMEPYDTTAWTYTLPNSSQFSFPGRRHYGGGFFGSSIYHQMQVEGQDEWDGAVRMPRQFGKSFFKDVICRDIPVIRKEDATAFIDTNSVAPFRHAGVCTQCHASMDRVAAGIRYHRTQSLDPSPLRYVDPWPMTLPTESYNWPSQPDGNYRFRAPTGTLYYRGYEGNLISAGFRNLGELGSVLAAQNEPYACIAKRYYQYFLGYDVSLEDLDDPDKEPLGDNHTAHRNKVIQLGLELKQHQDASKLIEAILTLPAYRQADFR